MKKIKLTIEYDGTNYVGWQHQPNGPSVQDAVEKALGEVVDHSVQVISSGRTDAGVHARGMVVHFETPGNLPLKAYREGVNAKLPADISIVSAEAVDDDFHARYSARAKRYRYSFFLGDVRSPLCSRYSWHIKKTIDVDAMRTAAAYLVGQHDFAAFRSSGCDAKTTVREIFHTEFKKHGRMLHFDIIGSGFLRNMVRVIVGTLAEVGLGKRAIQEIGELLKAGNRDHAGVTAPPHGLSLMQVWYDGNLALWKNDVKACKSCQKSLDK